MALIVIKAEPEPIEIETLQTAIIVVDMQNAFLSKGGYFDLLGYEIYTLRKIILPCEEVISVTRKKGLKIIYLQMG